MDPSSPQTRSLGAPAIPVTICRLPVPARLRATVSSPGDQALLLAVLVKNGLLTFDQIQAAAQRYGQENHRDLRQSILELNLISPERLNSLAFERLTSMAEGGQRHIRLVASARSGGRVPAVAATLRPTAASSNAISATS